MMELVQQILDHLRIVLTAMAIGTIAGVLLGIAAYWYRLPGMVILWIAETLQTIPSLALLALLMIVFGLGDTTMVAGLVLYALLPIVRNTHTGLSKVDPALREAARGMGMSRLQRLLQVELPLTFPLMFAGIRIALVNSLSIAVMGVLIGAGGLGKTIYRGIQTYHVGRILSGAVPVVLMAWLIDALMTKGERRLMGRPGA